MTDRVIKDTTLHVFEYILAQLLHNTTTEYDFDPDTFFTVDEASLEWLKSQETPED